MRVLVIEDDDAIRSMLRMMLGALGHHVDEASNGSRGLELVGADDSLDAVILDWKLPDLDGGEVLRGIRAIRPATPVLVSSGKTRELPTSLALERRTTLLPKPYGIGHLEQALRRAVGGSRSPGG